jgi:hypothetical protein
MFEDTETPEPIPTPPRRQGCDVLRGVHLSGGLHGKIDFELAQMEAASQVDSITNF